MSKTTTTAPQVTSAADWKARSEGEIKTLPSGATIRIKRPSLFALARSGHVPNPLAMEVVKWFAVTSPEKERTDAEKIADYRENAVVYVNIAAASVTTPKIVTDRTPNYDAGEIAPEDLSSADLIAIYNYVVDGIDLGENATFQPQATDTSGSDSAAV
jgi:hypothetical protein